MHPKAELAIYALTIKHQCGAWAARRFAYKRGISGLYRLAQQLEATKYL